MEIEAKRRLDAVLARESDRRKAATAERVAKEARERAREAEKQLARDQLPAFKKRLEGAVNDINEHLSGNGVSLSIVEGKRADEALAQIYVQLTGDEAPSKECQIVLNINALGQILPVFLIPHTGRTKDEKSSLATMSSEALTELVIEFLDQVFAHADKKGGR